MNTCKRIFIAALLLMAAMPSLWAQNTTSPYSMYGYGLLRDGATSAQRQMGGIGYAQRGGRQINAMNPASYASIDSLTFLWDIGADVNLNWRQELTPAGVTQKGHGVGGGLDYITMQFPITHYLGASIGLVPYSSVGYTFGDETVHGNLSNQGSGGITQLYAGVAGRLGGFSLGANFSYDFGNVINDVYAYTSTGNNTLFEHVMQVRDFNINIGAQYTHRLSRHSSMTLGVVYSPKMSMHGKTWANFWDITAETKADTVAMAHLGGNYYRPNSVGVGLSWQRARNSAATVEADFQWQGWKNAAYPALPRLDGNEYAVAAQQFNDRLRFAMGGSYVPRIRGNYLQRITYRLGFHYTRDYQTIAGNSVREFGIGAGFGFPTIEGKTIVNLGFEYLHRQASPTALVKENYFNITLGLNFNELWFFQRKIK